MGVYEGLTETTVVIGIFDRNSTARGHAELPPQALLKKTMAAKGYESVKTNRGAFDGVER
ncbi:MAG: hypothetical protein JO283_00360 [Bradyrhizobium sp.]|nr:hypothetical protein [Bradyrhizobium sp.]